MLRICRFFLLFPLLGMLLLSGCRTYGGYGTEPKTYEAMQKTVQSFEDELDRAKVDLRKLEKAAAEADTLQSLADHFQALVEEHKSLLDMQHQRIERLSPDATYRSLHQAYGATITERRLLREKYQRAIKQVRAVVQDTSAARTPLRKVKRQYEVRPIGFPRQNGGGELTMDQALRGL